MADNVKSEVTLRAGESPEQRMAEMMVSPTARGSFLQYTLASHLFGPRGETPDQRASFDLVQAELSKQQHAAASGDLSRASELLTTQAHVLDALFANLMHRALDNAGQFPDAMQRFMSLALKAQAQSRTAIETLARMHQPRAQIVKHVHVNEGGQAVVAEHLHIGTNGGQNAAIADQCHAPVAALPSPDPLGQGVPLPSGPGKEAVPDARRHEPRRAARQRQRSEARPENR